MLFAFFNINFESFGEFMVSVIGSDNGKLKISSLRLYRSASGKGHLFLVINSCPSFMLGPLFVC